MKRHSAERYLTVGFWGAVVTVIGELLGGFSASTDLTSQMARLLSAFEQLPVWRIGLCASIGGVGILLQYFGYYGIYLTFDDLHSHAARLYAAGNCGFTILGALIHVLCCVFIYLGVLFPGPERSGLLVPFVLWFMLPIFLLFFAGYLLSCITLFLETFHRRTLFPRWFCLLNPIFGMILFNLLLLILPSSALLNGIGFANMGLTSLIIFGISLRQLKISKPEAC